MNSRSSGKRRIVMENTFELKDLDKDFWNSVIFIYICHSSGMGGPGINLNYSRNSNISC